MVKSSIFRLRTVLMLLSLLSLATSCIDEDLSKCGSDYKIVYRMNLRTNMNVEIAQTLTTPEELAYADVLRQHLAGVFSDYAYDNDLSFYAGPELFHNVKNKMGASRQFAENQHVCPEVLAVKAGNDLIMSENVDSGTAAIEQAIKDKQISQKQINQSVLRILKLKEKLGLLK